MTTHIAYGRPATASDPIVPETDDEINKLAALARALADMAPEERYRALKWIKGKYPKEWPSDLDY